jgi:Kef-type K+ transport system membrane component KefB
VVVLAIYIPIHTTGFSASALAGITGAGRLRVARAVRPQRRGQNLMMRLHGSKSGQFLMMLLAVTIAAVAAEAIHLERIAGAFLAGIADGAAQ